MAFDDVFAQVGEFGRYQRRVYLLLCLPAISCALHKLAGVFLLAKSDHRCRLPCELNNATYSLSPEILNSSYPWDSKTKSYSSCLRYKSNYTTSEESCSINFISNKSEQCSEWVYDHSQYDSTVIEWNFVCNDAWLRATADSLFMVGVLLGSYIFGDLSDRFGRRPIFFISLVLQVIGGLAAAAMPEYISFMLARMLIGATTSGVFLVAYVIAMEMVGPSKRLIAGVVCQYFFTTGYILTAGFAYFIRDWRMLQVALSLPGVLFLCYWWFIPESARWLLANGRKEEAKDLIQKVARENKVSISDAELEALLASDTPQESPSEDTETPKPSVIDLMKHSNLRRKSFLIFFNWFVNSGTYYGLSWNTSNLGGNVYLNFFISGAVEIPAYSFLLLTLNRWGRKTILCGCMLLGGTALLLTIAVPKETTWLIITLAMVGKLAITASYGTIYVFTAEQFPTVIRNVALGSASTCARVGGILAPQVNLLADIWTPFPLVIFGSLAFMGGLLSLLLPETLHKKLTDTIEEGEKFGMSNENHAELHDDVLQNGIKPTEKESSNT